MMEMLTLNETSSTSSMSKKRKTESVLERKSVRKLTRTELEEVVLNKMVEVLTVRGVCGELMKQVGRLTEDNRRIKERAAKLKKQIQDLTEAAKRVRIERETKTVRVPRITRSVGLQVTPIVNKEKGKQDVIVPLDVIDEEKVETKDEKPSDKTKYVMISNSPTAEKKSSINSASALKSYTNNDPKLNETHPSDKTNTMPPLPKATKTSRSPEIISLESPLNLKVEKSTSHDGIVITWEKKAGQDMGSVSSYELEGSKKGSLKSEPLKWARIGVPITPLPLPMACNLNNFRSGVLYYFRVKAVFINGSSHYSNTCTITL